MVKHVGERLEVLSLRQLLRPVEQPLLPFENPAIQFTDLYLPIDTAQPFVFLRNRIRALLPPSAPCDLASSLRAANFAARTPTQASSQVAPRACFVQRMFLVCNTSPGRDVRKHHPLHLAVSFTVIIS